MAEDADVHSKQMRERAADLRRSGLSFSEVSRRLGVSRAAIREWETTRTAARTWECPRCEHVRLDEVAYAALLGFYLGDGCLSPNRTYYALRVACDATQPGTIADVTRCIAAVRPFGGVFPLRQPGCVVVTAHWKHWPCLFPQHGPGRKHLRPIVLEEWQRAIVTKYPAAFLRGLFHSDGSRVNNWVTRMVGGERKRYDYPRWQFCNHSDDIRALCCWALDLCEIPWRQSNAVHISVSTRAGVARLDELIGPKW